MNRQISLSALSDELSQAKTREKEFLEQMNRIIPWGEAIDSRAFSDFCGVDSSNQVSAGDTI